MKRLTTLTTFGISLMFLLSAITVSADNPTNIVSVQPASSVVQLDSLFEITIYLDLFEDISGWSIDELTFPPDLLSIESISEGDFFDGADSFFSVEGDIDNESGTVTDIICFSPFGDSVSESGSLCILTFKAKKEGLANIDFSATLSIAGSSIPHEENGATISIQGNVVDTTPPEISDVSASPISQFNGNSVNITCEAIDDFSVEDVHVIINGPSGYSSANVSMNQIQGADNYYFDTSYSIIGTYSFKIWAIDTSDNQNESEIFNFEIIENQNESPVAYDDYYTTNEDGTLSITDNGVLENDTDAEDDSLTAIKVTNPSHGTITEFNSDGTFAYVPDDDYCGSDSFTYKANDGFSDSNIATVHITVNCINDPPSAGFTYLPDSPTVLDLIDFTDESTDIDGNIVNWTWDFGNGNISYLQNPQHQYAKEGLYEVELIVRDSNDITDNITKTITIQDVPIYDLSIKITKPKKQCFYFRDMESTINTRTTLIIGKISIEVEIKNAIGPKVVSYYIDDNYIDNDTKAPHIWVCNERLFGKHTIKVVVEDSTGKTSSDSIEVRIFNFGGFGNGLSGLAKNR